MCLESALEAISLVAIVAQTTSQAYGKKEGSIHVRYRQLTYQPADSVNTAAYLRHAWESNRQRAHLKRGQKRTWITTARDRVKV